MHKPCYSILLFFILLFAGCKKEKFILVNDIGKEYTYNKTLITPGISVGSIYYSKSFNAFTDLTYFNSNWITVFREGTNHVGGEFGRIKLLSSSDGVKWVVRNVISLDSIDFRDPKLLIDSVNNVLYVTAFGLDLHTQPAKKFTNYIIPLNKDFSSKPIKEISIKWPHTIGYILWRWTDLKNNFYSLAYRPYSSNDSSTNLCLTTSTNAVDNFKIIKELHLHGQPTESTIRFDANNTLYITVRAETEKLYIGYSLPPYDRFVWLKNKTPVRLASPNFLLYKSYLLLSGRDMDDMQFKFMAYNLNTETIEKRYVFPGGLETGYGGMSFNPADKNEIWISYYAIEPEGSNINLAKIDLKKIFDN